MKQNIKLPGRIVRGIIGLAVIAWGVSYKSWWGAIGGFILFEAIMGWCVVHRICGSNECGKTEK